MKLTVVIIEAEGSAIFLACPVAGLAVPKTEADWPTPFFRFLWCWIKFPPYFSIEKKLHQGQQFDLPFSHVLVKRRIAAIDADDTAMFASDQPNLQKGKENEKPKSVVEKDDGAGNSAHVFGRSDRHAR